MLIEDLPAPLLRLKVLIWVHAALGAFLLVGLPVAALVTDRKELAIGVLPALFVWSFGVPPLRRRARELSPEDQRSPTGLPPAIPFLVGQGSLLFPLWFTGPYGGWVVAAWLLLAVTIAIRWGLSRNLAIPVHRSTWGVLLVALSIPLVFISLILVIVFSSGGC